MRKQYKVIVNSTCGLTGELMGGSEDFNTLEDAQAHFNEMASDANSSSDDTDVTLRDQLNMTTIEEFQNYED